MKSRVIWRAICGAGDCEDGDANGVRACATRMPTANLIVFRRQRPDRRRGCGGAAGAEAIEDGGVCFGLSRPGGGRLCGACGAWDRAVLQGLKEIEQDGLSVEFMILEFAEAAKLYVPLTRLDLIQKYRSTDTGPAPVLNKLGSQQWAEDQGAGEEGDAGHGRRAAEAVCAAEGRGGNGVLAGQRISAEFEDAFDYNETDDQLTAIAPSSTTWNRRQPMDRLLCGDVGYGKTEVAMRAAFKAVQDGKQVAVLTPTTVLAFSALRDFQEAVCAVPGQR
jgi:hypothetical protein